MKTNQLLLLLLVRLVSVAHVATAQDLNNQGESVADHVQQGESVADHVQEDDWNYKPSYVYQPNPKAIIHQKAQARALQRMWRMTAMRWYGMVNERPTASPTPFSALYSPAWQMPGGRPYAWNYRGTPSVLVFTH